MDKNTIRGLLLIGLILIGVYLYNSSQKPPIPPKAETSKIIKDKAKEKGDLMRQDLDSLERKALPDSFQRFASGVDEISTLENGEIRLKFGAKGGGVKGISVLKAYKYNKDRKVTIPVELIDSQYVDWNFIIPMVSGQLNTRDLYFKTLEVKPNSILLGVEIAPGKGIYQRYTVQKDSFTINHELILKGLDGVYSKRNNEVAFQIKNRSLRAENDRKTSVANSTIHYKLAGQSPDYLSETKPEKKDINIATEWFSFKQQFFTMAFMSPKSSKYESMILDVKATDEKDSLHEKEYAADATIPLTGEDEKIAKQTIYAGPLHYKTLKGIGEDLELERQIPLGWSFFITSWVNRFVVIPMFHWMEGFNISFGIIILLLTIYIKLLVLPLTFRSYLSTAKMRLLKPDIDAIKQRYPGDNMKVQQETMGLYRKAGVSPLGGCLPLLLQMPILLAMIRFFPSSIELRGQSFLWAEDLSTFDSIATLPFSIPFYGSHVSLFTIIMTVSTLLYTRMNQQMAPQQKELQWISYLMPIFFLVFFNNYAAGLSFYFFVSNLITIGQQQLFKLFINEQKLKSKIEMKKKASEGKVRKPSRWSQRIAELQKKQEEAMKQRQIGKGGPPAKGNTPIKGGNPKNKK